MARDRQRAKQRRRRRESSGGSSSRASRAKEIGLDDPGIERGEAGDEARRGEADGLTDTAPAPDPLKNAAPDVDQARAAETGARRKGPVEPVEPEEDVEPAAPPKEVEPAPAPEDLEPVDDLEPVEDLEPPPAPPDDLEPVDEDLEPVDDDLEPVDEDLDVEVEEEYEDDDYTPAPDEVEGDLVPTAADRGPVDPAVAEEAAEARAPRQRGRLLTFLGHCVDELRRVQWPNRRQVGQATAVVLGFVVLAGGYLGLLDALWRPVIDALI